MPTLRLLTCLLIPLSLQAQTPTSPVTHLHGTVIDMASHKPIAHALVASSNQRLATFTDNDGHFTLDLNRNPAYHAPQNGSSYSLLLQVSKPGFFPCFRNLQIPQDGTPVPDTQLPLSPVGSISGHVSTPSTDTPEHVPLVLLQRQLPNGRPSWVETGTALTDGRGNFHFTEVAPGDFVLLTRTWKDSGPPGVNSQAPEDSFPSIYSGDASSLDTALHLHMHLGQTQTADLHLHAARLYPVSLPVSVNSAADNVQAFFVGSRAFEGYSFNYNSNHHALEALLPAGRFHVLVQVIPDAERSSADTVNLAFAEREFQVNEAPLRVDPIAPAPSLPMPVRVNRQLSGTSPQAEARFVQLELIPATVGLRSSHVAIDLNTAQDLRNVQPGSYWVFADASPNYLSSLSAGGVDLSQSPLIVGIGKSPLMIDLTIANATGKLLGTVHNGGNPLPADTTVLLLPAPGGLNHMARGERVHPDGTVTVDDLIPGTYYVLALPPGSAPMALNLAQQVLLPSVPTVTIHPGEQTTVDVPFFSEAPVSDAP